MSSSSSSSDATSSSTSAFVSSLIFNGILATVFVLIFLSLRRKKRRVYEPRTLADIQTISEEERLESAPPGYFEWILYLLSKPHSYLLQHASIDGYFFLRYMGVVASLSFVACFILFPILLPVNATNGNNLDGFELLSFANVTNKNRFYAHVFLSWILFGLIIYVIYKELYYYVVVRHAIQTSPLYDGLLSSRTVILTELNSSISQPGEMEKRFPKASRIVYAHDHSDLRKLIKERKKTAAKYEGAINKVINKSVKIRMKAEKKGKLDELYNNGVKPEDDLQTYIPLNKRPTQRLGKFKIPFLGTKVDTIDYSRDHIAELNEKIHKEQADWSVKDTQPVCFMEFDSQLEAQRCYQSIESVLGSKSFGKRLIGVSPDDVNWDNVNFTKGKRRSMRSVANTILVLMIIFWAFPVAVVGVISNVTFLENKVFFLRWLKKVPKVILGLITGIVPSLALSILMSLVPPFIKKAGNMSGCTTVQEADLYCQAWYYAFQVIQVFLVVTLASSASSTVEAIIDDPKSAMTLLANNLPKASNFYISYFLVQGLTLSSSALLQLVNLILSNVLGRFLDSTPRQKWNRYNNLSIPSWGVIYPTIEVLVCIWICYSIIAPLVLVFSSVALVLLYLAFVYNINFVLGFSFDSKGRNYPRALFQIFVGLYLSEVSLLGLFIMAKTWGPLVLEVVMIVVTVLAHLYFKRIFIPLFDAVPLSAIRFARGEEGYTYPVSDLGLKEINDIAKSSKEEYENDETSGVIRPATEAELKRANLATGDVFSDSNAEKPTNLFGDEHRRSSSRSSSVGSAEEESIKKDTNVVKKSNTIGGESSKYASTFVGDENFHKLSYKDVEGLPREPPEEHQNADGALLENADVAKVYADPEAIVTGPNSFPPNVNSTSAFKERCINFFHPSRNYPFETVRMRLPHVFNTTIEYDRQYLEAAYTDPGVTEKDPMVWICEDEMGLSKQQINEAKTKDIEVSDAFTKYDEKGKSMFLFNPPDFEHEAQK